MRAVRNTDVGKGAVLGTYNLMLGWTGRLANNQLL